MHMYAVIIIVYERMILVQQLRVERRPLFAIYN
jgi:hypothetical protein